jgi:hypothetical protein
MWPEPMNMLSWWQWTILGLVPPAIVLLYFLKLRRKPLEVPSTYLWHKSIEDLRVNSIWQRLRRNLLMFLQLLVILLVMLAVLRLGWQGIRMEGNRFIFLVDSSASMQAKDEEPSRLERAKKEALDRIDAMKPGDVGMVVSFSDTARVEQMFTDNRRQLRRSITDIKPTPRKTSLTEAIKVASGLANPGRAAYDITDVKVAEAMPATLCLFSDGGFDKLTGINTGNLTPVYVPIGGTESGNVAITAFNVRRHETKATMLQAYARLENYGTEDVTVSLELYLDDHRIDADEVKITARRSRTGKSGGSDPALSTEPRGARGVMFDLAATDSGVLHLKLTTHDPLPLDDEAWAAISPPRQAKVLLVTPGNEALEIALGTKTAAELAELTVQPTTFLEKPEYRQMAESGTVDLVIFDCCEPKVMPQANTLFIGRLPPVGGWKVLPKVTAPQIIDVDPAHPLTQWLSMGDVTVLEATPLVVPRSGKMLIDSQRGPLLAITPREGFEDAVLGFVLLDDEPDAGGHVGHYFGTNWMIRPSFPVFALNVLGYLGGGRVMVEGQSVQPGQIVPLDNPSPDQPFRVHTPRGRKIDLGKGKTGLISFADTEELGVYDVHSGDKLVQQFAVNLFSPQESDIRSKPEIQIGHQAVAAKRTIGVVGRREIWKWIVLAGLAVLCIEWYLYGRRVGV